MFACKKIIPPDGEKLSDMQLDKAHFIPWGRGRLDSSLVGYLHFLLGLYFRYRGCYRGCHRSNMHRLFLGWSNWSGSLLGCWGVFVSGHLSLGSHFQWWCYWFISLSSRLCWLCWLFVLGLSGLWDVFPLFKPCLGLRHRFGENLLLHFHWLFLCGLQHRLDNRCLWCDRLL